MYHPATPTSSFPLLLLLLRHLHMASTPRVWAIGLWPLRAELVGSSPGALFTAMTTSIIRAKGPQATRLHRTERRKEKKVVVIDCANYPKQALLQSQTGLDPSEGFPNWRFCRGRSFGGRYHECSQGNTDRRRRGGGLGGRPPSASPSRSPHLIILGPMYEIIAWIHWNRRTRP